MVIVECAKVMDGNAMTGKRLRIKRFQPTQKRHLFRGLADKQRRKASGQYRLDPVPPSFHHLGAPALPGTAF